MSDSDQEILELIDQGSFSYAQQLLNRKLKKYPNRSYYHALNNHLLYSQGKINESIENNLKLMEKIPSDPDTLDLLNEFFTKVGYEKESNLVYENAVKKYANNQLILSWFNSSIKKFDLRLIQKILMVLQKNNKANRAYGFWSSFSCYLLVGKLNNEKEINLFNSLGIKLIENLKPFENDQELFTLIKFLENVKNYQQIIVEIDEFLLTNSINLELKLIYLKSLEELCEWDKLFDYCKHLIFTENFNDFDTWKLLLKASKRSNKPVEEINQLISSFKFSRNSTLSLIELSIYYNDNVDHYVNNYYNLFNNKTCCFNDLKNYISFINKEKFLLHVNDSTNNSIGNGTLNGLIKLINNQKFNYLINEKLDMDEFIRFNWEIFNKFNQLLESKEEFDSYPANELILMSIIIDLKKNSSTNNLFKNLILLQKLLSIDKYDSKLRLWLINLYSNLGLSNLLLTNYKQLNIKMIQHDTLSHYLNLVPSSSNLNELINIFRFYLTADQEINESIHDGFNKSIFSKLQSFINFGERITFSISKFLLILNITKFSKLTNNVQFLNYFINLIKNFEHCIINEDFNLSDNRDFKTIWKFGINKEETNLFNLPIKHQEFVELHLIKELILINNDPTKLSKLMKLFTKLLNNNNLMNNQLTKFEVWLFKIYLNIFKLIKSNQSKEHESVLNYLNKNLKLNKIKHLLVIDNSLSWEFNSNLSDLIELIKDIQKLAPSLSTNNVKSLINQLIKDLKSFDFKSLQIDQLHKAKDSVAYSNDYLAGGFIHTDFINECFESFENSIIQSQTITKFI